MSGRTCQLTIELMDKPGQLLAVSKIVADLGGNVTEVHHEPARGASDVNGCYLSLSLETRDFEHIEKIRAELEKCGFRLV